jgi:hypothetical protein
MNNSSSERGSRIRPDQAAFVVDPDGRVSFLLPSQDLDAPLAPGHRLLLALAARLNDPEWVEELLVGSGVSAPRKLGFF